METKHDKHSGNAFLWGLIIGALLVTLLTTKRGRQILRELTNLALELFEDFVEKKTQQNKEPKIHPEPLKATDTKREDVEQAEEDIESEITEIEASENIESEASSEAPTEAKTNGNGHKKRLFKGIRRK